MTEHDAIVDAHVHFWELDRFHYPWLADPGAEGLNHDYLPADLAADIGELPVRAIVHVQAEMDHALDPAAETAWLASLKEAGSPGAPTVCVGYADLRSPDLPDVLDRHEQFELFRGIRQEAWFDPQSQRADIPRINLLDDPAWQRGLDELERRGLTFDLLVWPAQLEQAAAIFRERPGLPVVVEHLGLPVDPEAREVWRSAIRAFAQHVPHALLKISALRFISPTWDAAELSPVVAEAIDLFGVDRCMLGSNFPVDRPAVSYRTVWARFGESISGFSAVERAAVLHGTAQRFYRISLG
jgi:Predicted metal-dependent hydrolase of the TIM-barrel fold